MADDSEGRDFEFAWAIGLFEGEGCIYSADRQKYIRLSLLKGYPLTWPIQ